MNLRNREGFTLLELLISVTLSVVILVILLAAIRLAHKSEAKGVERAELSQRVRILGDRITWLIRGLYPFVFKPNSPDEKRLFFEGTSDQVGFVTSSVDASSSGPADLPGLKWVTLFTDEKGLHVREKVFFLEDPFEESGGEVYTIDPDVKKLSFEYHDIPQDETEGSWVSEWSTEEKDYLPVAIRFTMTLSHYGKEVELPEITVVIRTEAKPPP